MNATRLIALLTGLLPIIAIHTTYVVSAMQGHVPWCVPYFESCTSISATGRHGAAFFIFKGTIIPSAVLLMMFWYLAGQWLRQLGDGRVPARVIFVIGTIGGIFLIVYTVALGASGDAFRLQRRIGIIFYFTLTYLAQLLMVYRMGKLSLPEPTRPWLLGLCVTTLLIGLSTLVIDQVIDNYDDYEDAFEWIVALLIHLFFLIMVLAWKRTGYQLHYSIRTEVL